jgi:osmoprotectant transport system ATP-binding protein
VIEFVSVGKTSRTGGDAVVDLTLSLPPDQITVLAGPPGCGQTTALRMVNRLVEPSRGRITWDGSPLQAKRKTALRRQVGYVVGDGGLFPHRTVLDNIGTVPGLLGWSQGKTRKRSLELLGVVGLNSRLAARYPVQLSEAQRRRVAVARALAADPRVLLLDDPFSALDPVVRAELHEFLLGLQSELSMTVVLATHDIDEAFALGDRVAVFSPSGRLAQLGTAQELLDHPADDFVAGFVGRDRGYRALSFRSASPLSLASVKVVRSTEAARGDEPTLVVDVDAKPQGWADARRPGQLLGLGSTFDPARDTLQVALDAALTSPVGLAVATDRTSGRYAGVVDADAIVAQLATVRRSATGATPPEPAPSPPDGSDPAPGTGDDGVTGGANEKAADDQDPKPETATDQEAPATSRSGAEEPAGHALHSRAPDLAELVEAAGRPELSVRQAS